MYFSSNQLHRLRLVEAWDRKGLGLGWLSGRLLPSWSSGGLASLAEFDGLLSCFPSLHSEKPRDIAEHIAEVVNYIFHLFVLAGERDRASRNCDDHRDRFPHSELVEIKNVAQSTGLMRR